MNRTEIQTIVKKAVDSAFENNPDLVERVKQRLSRKEKVKRARARDREEMLKRRSDSMRPFRSLEAGVFEAEKNCSVGNPNHSGANDDSGGQFVSKARAGSWSIKAPKAGDDCRRGQYEKKYGSKDNEQCGRGAKRKCKDGTIKEASVQETWRNRYEVAQSEIAALKREIKRLRTAASLEMCLKKVNAVQQAAKGDYPAA
jgi:hypothetical protein